MARRQGRGTLPCGRGRGDDRTAPETRALGDSSRISWAREQLIASGKLASEACEGKNLPPSRPEIAAAAVRAVKALSPEPEREPTPIGLEIRAAMKRERERGKWTIAGLELAGA